MDRLILILLIALSCAYVDSKEIDNNVIFEKFEYQIFNHSLVKVNYLEIKPVGHNVLRANGSYSILQPLNDVWLRGTLYYKYVRYQKFLVNLEFNVCDLFANMFNMPFTKLIIDNLVALYDDISELEFDLDYELKCPLNGTASAYHPHFNMSKIVLPLLPAGRYRADYIYRTHKYGKPVALLQLFFQISDLRVWF